MDKVRTDQEELTRYALEQPSIMFHAFFGEPGSYDKAMQKWRERYVNWRGVFRGAEGGRD